MCGIAGAYLRDPKLDVDLDSMLNTMLEEIEHRGGDATGFLALDSNGVAEWHRAACDVPDFVKYRRPVPKGTRTILAHTRYATQGLPAFVENNHPIRRGSFYVIHNGHVGNDQELFKLSGRRPFGQVDSEAIPARLASLGKLTDANIVMEEIVGSAAIAAVDEKNPGELLLAKASSSPLHVLVTNRIVVWGSTAATVAKAYKKHVGRLPKKRQIESLPEGVMIHFDAEGKQTRTKFEVYVPTYKTYTYQAPAWSETMIPAGGGSEQDSCSVPATRYLPTVNGWPEWDKTGAEEAAEQPTGVECDQCQAIIPLSRAEWDTDQDGTTWMFCPKCWAELQEEYSEEFDTVNKAVLLDGYDGP
jgi:predicted glutamine amidotransferase